MVCEYCFWQCESVAYVTFDADITVSGFDARAFSSRDLALIDIPSSAKVICEVWFSECRWLASVTHDPDSKFQMTLSVLLIGPFFDRQLSGDP
jgi:hypothetical protein